MTFEGRREHGTLWWKEHSSSALKSGTHQGEEPGGSGRGKVIKGFIFHTKEPGLSTVDSE